MRGRTRRFFRELRALEVFASARLHRMSSHAGLILPDGYTYSGKRDFAYGALFYTALARGRVVSSFDMGLRCRFGFADLVVQLGNVYFPTPVDGDQSTTTGLPPLAGEEP